MKTKLLIFILTILSLLYCLSINAQVTIGSYEKPIAGALLDLKEQTPGGENTTGTKGFGLPRVNLKKQSPKTPAAFLDRWIRRLGLRRTCWSYCIQQ